jgi:hypothetical protein
MKVTVTALALLSLATVGFAASSPSEKVPGFGFVQGAAGGSRTLALTDVPANVRHAAEVALAGYGSSYTVMNVSLDLDEVEAIYEIRTRGSNGRIVEVDVDASGKIEELELEIRADEVPANVMEALARQVPTFETSKESPMQEKSLRPSKNGLLEVWYEFSGTNFDVEIRSDAKVIVIEPA